MVMEKKKILYIVSTLKKSGPINIVKNIIRYLDRDSFEPIILTLSKEPKNSDKDFFENDLQVKVYSLNLGRLRGIFYLKDKINDFIVQNNIDLIHSHGLRPDIFSSFSNVLKISTLHNNPFLDYSYSFGKIKGYLIAKIQLYFIKKFDKKISCSKSISEILRKQTGINFDFIQNGIYFKDEILCKDKLRKKLGFSKNEIIFISVGVLNERKDPLTIIEVLNRIKKENFKLLFLGNGSLFKICKEKAKNKNIVFLGNVDNVFEYLKASDYFISASLTEGLPNSVLEAMSCGLPCLLSDIPSHQEIIYKSKLSKYIFKTKNSDELFDNINDIILDDYKNLSKISKDIIDSNFTAKIMSYKYQNLYKEVLGIWYEFFSFNVDLF